MVAMRGGLLTGLQVLTDPVQRCWLLGRLRNRWPATAEVATPAYLQSIPGAETPGPTDLPDLQPGKPTTILLTLPGGETLRVVPGKTEGLIDRRWDDPAAAAAFQGFAWLAQDPDGTALAALWPAWLDRHATVEPSTLAWHPDIVAERSLALLDRARSRGLPAPRQQTLTALAAHAAALLASFAERTTPPALLARRAHALIRLGLDLAMPATAGFGLTALLAESDRLLLPSGVSNLESTHYHLRLCQSLADAWLAAHRHGRQEEEALECVLRRAMAVLPQLTLPGGLPLIGDVVENLPPGWMNGLLRGAALDKGWTGQLPAGDRARLAELCDDSLFSDLEALRDDGWLRVDLDGWSGLWHAAPDGWPAFDGFGHQDLGSCELHFEGVPIFIDAGGGRQSNINGRSLCRKATAHGGLQLNRRDPYPLGHPDYSEAFRRQIGGMPPRLRAEFDGASLVFGALAGVGGLRDGSRYWHFADGGFVIDDMLNGTGRTVVGRRFLTPLAVRREGPQTVLLEGEGRRFRLSADQPVTIGDGCRWSGFGITQPLHVIEISGRLNLPWRGRVRVLPC